ncbi:hypothetical protein DUI70_5138 [Streptomyces albus]|nr:hypothetical protein DUI70_5138 [Streptomyces albus]
MNIDPFASSKALRPVQGVPCSADVVGHRLRKRLEEQPGVGPDLPYD